MTEPVPADPSPHPSRRRARQRRGALATVLLTLATFLLVDDPMQARAAAIAVCCMLLWLTELTAAFVPTLLLFVLIPLLLGPQGDGFQLPAVLRWAADPVLALFLGGLSLGLAASRHGLDTALAGLVIAGARGRRVALVLLVMCGTAFLSMWMSNVAAAAMMIAVLHPMTTMHGDDAFRRALLVSVALGANLGGMATPVGTGPNAIAVAALAQSAPVSFASWMLFALPLTAGMLLVAFGAILLRFRVRGHFDGAGAAPHRAPMDRRSFAVAAVLAACVAMWLTEPWHGVSSSLVALAVTAVLFGTGLLAKEDLHRIDWATLMLIAGGLVLGHLLDASGLLDEVAARAQAHALQPWTWRLGIVAVSAILSALMSNTATATMLIPIAMKVDPSPATAILVAMGCSLGFPFVISTPPNAMVHGQGVRAPDLAAVAMPVMVIGCVVVGVTGPTVLAWMGWG